MSHPKLPTPPFPLMSGHEDPTARRRARDRERRLVDPAMEAERARKHAGIRLEPATVEGIRADLRHIEFARARQRRSRPTK